MLKFTISFFMLCFALFVHGSPRVPSEYEFADIKLSINEAARKEIQEDVDALQRNQTYFQRKVEKVDLYFPIIERVFKEENLPDDFKYLVIQESALIPDAVSSSNAVGFWQFKEASAKEVGLRIDRNIDERMHITASSKAAAKYLKKNNFFFDNWLYALLAYNTGPGGAEQHVEKKYLGKKKMEITKHTHWYVKKFLAHKIAFENEIHKTYAPTLKLYEYDKTHNKSLKELSDYFEIEHQSVVDYNKWLRHGRIPTDKTYLAIIPVSTNDLVAQNLLDIGIENKTVNRPKSKIVFQDTYEPIADFDFNRNQEFPKINNKAGTSVKINGIPGFIASASDDINSVTAKHGISENKFLKMNDMTASEEITEGQVYYLKSKKSKAKIHYHVVLPGENAWSISQKYGIKVKKLLTKNRMREEKDLSPGMVMWLRFIRPADVPVEYKETDVQNVIVKSIPNDIEYPQKTYPPVELTNVDSNGETIADEPGSHNEDSDFLFEELDDETEYINENSYVNLSKEEEKTTEIIAEKKSGVVDEKKIGIVDENNVKKEEIYHIVKSGETLFSISRLFGVTIGELRQWNEIDNLDILNVGQRLLINVSKRSLNTDQKLNTSKEYITYTVKQDDTLYGIARKHEITIKELMELNSKDDFNIKEGEILKIKAPN